MTSLLRSWVTGEAVRELQQRLAALGHTLPIDGEYGPVTESVVRAFQAARAIRIDGICGPHTRDALKALLSTRQNSDWLGWPASRRLIAGNQAAANAIRIQRLRGALPRRQDSGDLAGRGGEEAADRAAAAKSIEFGAATAKSIELAKTERSPCVLRRGRPEPDQA